MKRYNWLQSDRDQLETKSELKKQGGCNSVTWAHSAVANLQISLCQSAQITSLKISMINSIEWCVHCTHYTVRTPKRQGCNSVTWAHSAIENPQISLCQSAQITSLKISMINSIEWCVQLGPRIDRVAIP
jgi:hypothetical protein